MVSCPEVAVGWYKHHSKMLQDQKFSTSFEAWHNMDKQLCTQFIDSPFIVDPTCSTYFQIFKQAHMDTFLVQHEKLQQQQHSRGHSSFRGGRQDSGHVHNSPCYNPYDKESGNIKPVDSF